MVDATNDQPVSRSDTNSLSVIQAIEACRVEAEDARWERIWRNKTNRDVFLGRQDYSEKTEGQSQEFLPKVPVSIEQMAAFVKKGLVQFGSWFSVEVDNQIRQVISGQQIEALLSCFLDNLWAGNNNTTDVSTIISDGVKNGLLESLIIFKVHGAMMPVRKFTAARGVLETGEDGTIQRGQDDLEIEESQEWRLRIDLIPPEDYYPDPTGRGLYEVHRCERDLHEVIAMAEDGVYDMAVVRQLIDTDFKRAEDEERSDRDRNQQETTPPSFRKRVVLDEFWGTLLNSDGTVAHRNIVATVANYRYLIRPPEPNPFWHQESCFVAVPLIRVPWSVWHKALYDDAANLNIAMNELFNLILDGGIASVWGTRQVRLDDLEDPTQVSGGVPQGATLAVKGTLPHNAKVLEQITEGEVPSDALALFQMLNQEFTQAVLTNEIKLGMIPRKEVRATEVIEASSGQAVTLEGILGDFENNGINKLLHKAWLTILQNADSFPQEVLMGHVDRRVALLLSRASPAERFALFAGMCKFRTFGLSATMSRAREFQKLMAVQTAVNQSPLLLQAFMRRFSADRTLDYMFRLINLNPDHIYKTLDEQEQADQEAQRTLAAQQLTGGASGGTPAGGASVPAQANQLANPLSGMTANA